LFLGAGASAPFGYPTTLKFISDLKEELGSTPELELLNHILGISGFVDAEHVLELLDVLHNINKHPFQEFIQTYQTYIRFKGDKAAVSFLDLLNSIEQLRGKIQSDVFRQYQFNPNSIESISLAYKPLIELLFSITNNSPLSIFTTNYDRVIENFCRSNKLHCIDGFKRNEETEEFEWHPEEFDRRTASDKAPTIKLFKLHGSLNWLDRGNNTIERVSVEGKIRTKQHKGNLLIYPAEKLKPEIEPFKKLHELFQTEFGHSDITIFIGFAFRDEYLNNVIRQGSEKNKIIIVSPSASELVKKPIGSASRFKSNPTAINANFGEAKTLQEIEKAILNQCSEFSKEELEERIEIGKLE
jgi:hypothetical protein